MTKGNTQKQRINKQSSKHVGKTQQEIHGYSRHFSGSGVHRTCACGLGLVPAVKRSRDSVVPECEKGEAHSFSFLGAASAGLVPAV